MAKRIVILALLAVSACKSAGTKGGTPTTPEELGKAFADAVSRNDGVAAAALFTPEAVVHQALTCQNPKVLDQSLKSVADARDKLLARIKAKPDTHLKFLAAQSDGTAQTFVKGTERNGCTINFEIVAMTMRLRFDEQRGGEALGPHAMLARVVQYGSAGTFLEDLEEMNP